MSKPLPACVAARRVVRNRSGRWIAEALEGRRMLATTPVIVGDINQTTDQLAPGPSVQVGNVAFFAGRPTAADGPELFKTDGTKAGTVLVKDINATTGSAPSNLTKVGGLLYFTADDGTSGVELWKSDGTAAGTTRVADLFVGLASSNPSNLTAVGSQLYFTATDPSGTTLWTTDGTAAGTAKVVKASGGTFSSVAGLVAFNGGLLFGGGDYSNGRTLFRVVTVGGAATPVAGSPSNVSNLTAFNGAVYFTIPASTTATTGVSAGDLWRTDGTAAGTSLVKAIDVSTFVTDYATTGKLTVSGDRLDFLSGTSTTGKYDLWASDGTTAGTLPMTSDGRFVSYSSLSPVGARSVLFVSPSGTDLYVSDGTTAGTKVLESLPSGAGSGTTYFGGVAPIAGGRWLFTTARGYGTPVEIFTTDGTSANTAWTATIRSVATVGVVIGSLNGVALIDGERGVSDGDLYRSDATSAGTYRLGATGIANASSLSDSASPFTPEFTAIGDTVYFAASDGATGYELWRAVGDAAPQRVVDQAIGGADARPSDITAGGDGSVYFTVNASTDVANPGIYWIDKTGKLGIFPLNPQANAVVPGTLVAFGNDLLFKLSAGGQYARPTLWIFDPALGHAEPVFTASSFLDPGNVVVSNGYALFGAVEFTGGGSDTSNQRLFRLSPNSNLAQLVATFPQNGGAYPSSPSPVGVGGTNAYFEITTPATGNELYAVTTTAAGATTASLVSDLSPGSASTDFNLNAPQSTIYAAGIFYFSAQTSGDSAYRVYRTDGTAAGTRAIGTSTSNGTDLSVDAPSFAAIDDGTNVGTTVYFVGKFGANPEPLLCLITSDGSLYNYGRYSEFVPYALIGGADTLYAIGLGGENHDRFDLWRMAGINASFPSLLATLGPKVSPIVGGPLISFWSYGRYAMAATDTNLFFPWYNAATGIEPGRLPLAATPVPEIQGGTVAEGASTQIGGSDNAYTSPEARLRYEWDFNYDGKTFDVDATGSETIFSAANIDGPATRTVALRITNAGNRSAITTSTVTILNVAPTATLTATSARAGASSTFAFSNVTDPGVADTAAGFTYSFDLNGDGDFTDAGEVDRGTSPTIAYAFATAGQYTVNARVYDKDGDYRQYRRSITVDSSPTPPAPTSVGFDNTSLAEGASATLFGYALPLAAGQSIVKWEYDFNYDGKTFDVDATGQRPTFVAPDGNATRTIAVRVTDNFGHVVIGSQTLRIDNVAPTATLTVTGGAGTATATFTRATDPSAIDVAAGFKYSFDFNNDGDFTDPGEVDRGTSPTAAGTYAVAGTYTILAKIYDKDGDYSKYAATVVVTAPPVVVNQPPVPKFAFPAGLAEGDDVVLAGTATVATGRTVAKWEWDFDYDGATFAVDATGQQPQFAVGDADGPTASRRIALRVTDSAGQVGLFAASGPIANAPPFAEFIATADVDGTATLKLTGATDASAADRAAGFKYSFDFNGDGDYADAGEVANGASPIASFKYATAGTYRVRGRVTDKDGGSNEFATDLDVTVPPPTSASLTGTVIGTAGSFGNAGNTVAKAFDGSLTTYFDAAVANGAWAGLDLGAAKTITSVKFAPRAGWSSRMVGGLIQGSSTADFSGGVVTLATIASKPAEGVYTTLAITNAAAFRYVRYLTPAGSYGNVAELAFYGTAGTTPPPVTPPVTPPPTSATLTGTAIGTSGSFGNGGNTIAKAFDGSLTTFVDLPVATGGWAGLDLGAVKSVAGVRYAPRAGWSARMVGGVFQGSTSADFSTGVVTLATIAAKPTEGVLTSLTFASAAAYRYVRYLGPAGSYGDVAEVQFVGPAGTTTPPVVTPPATPTKLTGTTIGTAGSYLNGGNTIAKATDGNLATFFDGPAANGNWVGLDLGAAKVIAQIGYAPRSGFASRLVGGVFQGSNNADFSNASTLLAITQAPAAGVLPVATVTNATAFRYVRYLAPAGSYGDVAEIAFYG